MTTASVSIIDLPNVILLGILSHLSFENVSVIAEVSTLFASLCKSIITTGVERILKILRSKSCSIATRIVDAEIGLEEKVRLNQSYTVLEMVALEVHSFYVKNRCCTNVEFGRFLDDVFGDSKMMDINNFPLWSTQTSKLQKLLTMFNMQKMSLSQKCLRLPLGVHFMELLDLSIELDYEITCIYNLQEQTCSIIGNYYTHQIKVSPGLLQEPLYRVNQFLSFIPDVFYLSECIDRRIELKEGASILKYLSFLVHMYNCMFCKSEEYRRDMRLREDKGWVVKELHTMRPRRCTSRCVQRDVVVENYTKSLEEGACGNGLLSCEIFLKCNLSEAPYQIKKNYDELKNNFIFESRAGDEIEENYSDYGVEVNLRLELHRNNDVYEVGFKDGIDV